MRPTLLTQTLRIAAAQWRSVITVYVRKLGPPTQVLPPGADPLDADEVRWNSSEADLLFIKETQKAVIPGGNTVILSCASAKEATTIFNELKDHLPVKDDLRVLREFALIDCKLVYRDILLASVYVPQTTDKLEKSDLLGVIHNPNYPDALYAGKGFIGYVSPAQGRVLTYGLAGLVGAALATWLGRRR